MMKESITNRISAYYYQQVDKDNFETLFYWIFLLSGLILTVLTSLMNFILGLSTYTIILPLFSGGFAFATHLFYYKRKKETAALFIIINNNFFFSPFMWLTNSGFKGGFQYFLFLFLIISITVLKGTTRFIIVSLYIMTAFILMIVEANFPEIIMKLSEGNQNNVIDMIFSIILSLIIITVITFILTNLYTYRQKKIIELSIKDPLTKQYNRRYLISALDDLYHSDSQEINNKFAVFIDVDNFKMINDQLGHVEGDKILCNLCKTINDNVRSSDYLARMGGDEFVLILNTENPKIAEKLVKRIVKKAAEETKVTISAGLTPLKGKKNIYDLLEKADKLMYEAKTSGKNRVWLTGESQDDQ
jgi:diguanylate cyclase (GGDEF)-like protein